MKHWNRLDQFIFAGATVLLIMLSYLLYDDSMLFPRRSPEELQKIGQVGRSDNDVRLKSATDFTWVPAQKEEKVFAMDSVFTGERSSTLIELDGGSTLELGENSLITLTMVDGQLQLDLRFGEISANLAALTKIKVIAGEKAFEIQGSSRGSSILKISKPSAGEVDMKLEKGAARIKAMTGAPTQKLVKGQNLEMGEDGKLAAQESVTIWLETPPGTKFYRLRADDPVDLRWTAEGPSSGFDVEICADPDCKRVIHRKGARNETLAMTDSLLDGAYHWRVKAFDKGGKEIGASEIRNFSLLYKAPPKIIKPSVPHIIDRTIKVAISEAVLTAKTNLRWETDRRFKNYRWQVSTQSNFVTIAAQGETTEGEVETPELTSSDYYYRVQGDFQLGEQSAWSELGVFRIKLKPELVARPLTPYFLLSKIVFDPVRERLKNTRTELGPTIRWSSSPTASGYRLEIDTSKDFSDPIVYRTEGPAMLWKQFQHGDFYLRVTAFDASGIQSLQSQTGILQVVTTGPVLAPFERVVVRAPAGTTSPTPAELKARWVEVPKAGGYMVQWSLDPEFGGAQELRTKSNAAVLPVSSPGRYFVRVRALDTQGAPLTEFSNVQRGLYDFVVPRFAPTLVEPFDKASIFLQSTLRPFLWLEWKPVKEVVLYQVEIAQDAEFKQIFVQEKLSENRYLIRRKIPTGVFFWRVRALTENHELVSDWSEPRSFTITN